MNSWKTTVAGIAAIIAAVMGAINLLFDGNPATNPDWGVLIPIILAGITGLVARDNDKTSEEVGATKK